MKDFAQELGCLGFTMRLKRISDALMHDGKRMYKELGLDIEPNWYVVFRLLNIQGSMSVTQIADKVGMSHPSVITITNNMMKAGYLSSAQCEDDSRKRNLTLTEKANDMLPRLEEIWNAGERGVLKVLEGTEIMKALTLIEERYNERGFKDRTLDELSVEAS